MRRALGLLVLVAACGKPEPERPNVLLVTIDTLRADAVGPETPAIRDFLAEARWFRRSRTVAPLTLPAHVSMFTGLFPASHAIHDNVTEPLPPRGERPFPLLAEQFRDKGYATAAFVARAVLAPATGVGGGFDVYDCPATDADAPEEGYLPGPERAAAALAWIANVPPGKPWFAWVHLFDPHAPYQPFPGDARRPATTAEDPTSERYMGEVRRADAAIEALLKAVGPGTVVVLVTDHGESLMEHGEPTHGPLCYGSTIDAFLAVRAPGLARGTEDHGLRSVADVAPTLRRVCGLEAAKGDARDLAGPPHETLVAESMFTWSIHGWGQVFSVTDGEFSLVESGDAVELFDRRRDPGETSTLGLSHPAYEKLDRALERFRSSWGGGGAGEEGELLASVMPYGEMRRRDEGYLPRAANAKLANPRERLKDWAMLETVPPLIRICAIQRDPARLEETLRMLDDIQSRNPVSPRVDHYRAKVHGALGDMTGRLGRFSHAAWAELAAIEKGYVQRETIAPAIAYAVAGSDAMALRRLAELLKLSGKRLEPDLAAALAQARQRLPSEAPAYNADR